MDQQQQHETASEWFMKLDRSDRKKIVSFLFDQARYLRGKSREFGDGSNGCFLFEEFMRRVDNDHHYAKKL